CIFFFQAEDGIRDRNVTGVQTCALPILRRYRIDVGRSHGVKPANIVGAIANEANLNSNAIGRIDIFPKFSTVDLPEKMSSAAINHLQTVWVAGRQLDIRPDHGGRAGGNEGADRKSTRL